MASLSQLYLEATQLNAERKAAWIKACEVDGIDPKSSFVVLSNSTEAAAYNELAGMFLRAKAAYLKQKARNAAKRARTQMFKDLGVRQVRGVSGVYFE